MVWRKRGMDALRLSFALQHTSIKWRSASNMLMSTPDSYDAEWAVKVSSRSDGGWASSERKLAGERELQSGGRGNHGRNARAGPPAAIDPWSRTPVHSQIALLP
jgi:hypothetical protein